MSIWSLAGWIAAALMRSICGHATEELNVLA
jgi:hypothetical protein